MKNRMNQRLVAVVLGLSMALAACKGGKPFPTEESSVGGKMTETGSEKNSPSETKKQEEGTTFDREETPMVGGWSINKGHFSPEENKDAMKAFHKAINGLTGYYYEVVAVLGSQVVAGTNYAYLCRGNVVVPDAEPTYLILYVYENLIGKARILDSQSIFTGNLGGVIGDFSLNNGKTELQENAAVSAALEKAVANLADVSYEPIASFHFLWHSQNHGGCRGVRERYVLENLECDPAETAGKSASFFIEDRSESFFRPL